MRVRVRSIKRVVIATQLLIIIYFLSEEMPYQYDSTREVNATTLDDAVPADSNSPDIAAPEAPPSETNVQQPVAPESPAGAPPPPPPPPPPPGPQGPPAAAPPAPGGPPAGGMNLGPTGDQTLYMAGRTFGVEDPFPGLSSAIGEIPEEERNYMRVRYTPPPITDIAYPGHKMKVPADYGREVAELTNHLVTLSPDTLENFVFVTGASSNHFDESRDAVASAQTQFPGKPILYFDLGLQENEISELKKWESVEYRWFNFSHYPGQFLVNLRRAAWKPFIIAEALKQYGGVFYMDSSIRVMTHDLQPAIRLATYNGGFVQFHGAKYSIYGGTHEKLYTYFPTKKPMMKNLAMNAGGALLVYNTEKVYKQLLWWWSMCTLDKQCYIPTLEMNCDMHTYDKWKDYMHCHKFDTSIINILLSNLHGYDATKYLAQDGMINIEKMPTTHFRTKYKS